MLEEIKQLFGVSKLYNTGLMIQMLHEFIDYFEEDLVSESARNAFIDAAIKILESEKK